MNPKTPALKYRTGDPLETDVRQTADRVPKETEEVEFLEKVARPFPIERLKEELQAIIRNYKGALDRSTNCLTGAVYECRINELEEVLKIIQRLET